MVKGEGRLRLPLFFEPGRNRLSSASYRTTMLIVGGARSGARLHENARQPGQWRHDRPNRGAVGSWLGERLVVGDDDRHAGRGFGSADRQRRFHAGDIRCGGQMRGENALE